MRVRLDRGGQGGGKVAGKVDVNQTLNPKYYSTPPSPLGHFWKTLQFLIICRLSAAATPLLMDWNGYDRERIDLTKPLLIVKGKKGFLACAYINAQACDKIGEACALVTGVSNHDDMLVTKIHAVSQKAADLGVQVSRL